MIIAAFTGCGKSYFAQNVKSCIDLESMTYKYLLPKHKDDNINYETVKASRDTIPNPLWNMNYILDILQVETKYKYVLIPTDYRIIETLIKKYDRNVLVVFPNKNLKDDYKNIYIDRGNTDNFTDIFIGRWDYFMQNVRELDSPHKIELQKGQSLLLVKDRIDEIIERNEFVSVSNKQLMELQKQVDSKKYSTYISVEYETKNGLVEYIHKIIFDDDKELQGLASLGADFPYLEYGPFPFLSKETIECFQRNRADVSFCEVSLDEFKENIKRIRAGLV